MRLVLALSIFFICIPIVAILLFIHQPEYALLVATLVISISVVIGNYFQREEERKEHHSTIEEDE